MSRNTYFGKLLAIALLTAAPFITSAAIEDTASVVLLRTSCNDGAGGTLNNCFVNMRSLRSWIDDIRNPSASSPLLVEIGPGQFDQFVCFRDSITLRGAGAGKTILTGGATFGIEIYCADLTVENLTASGGVAGVYLGGYMGNGNANAQNTEWLGVEVKGNTGWFRASCFSDQDVHRWRASRIVGVEIGYDDFCGEHWFLGSEIVADARTATKSNTIGVLAEGGEYHFYGSNIRALGGSSPGGTPYFKTGRGGGPKGVVAVAARWSEVHIHGTGVDAIGSGAYDVAALMTGADARVHANGDGYALSVVPGQTQHRILDYGAAYVRAPYLWEEYEANPPANLGTADGADITIVTTPGGTPKMLVYAANCPSKWFDVGSNNCWP